MDFIFLSRILLQLLLRNIVISLKYIPIQSFTNMYMNKYTFTLCFSNIKIDKDSSYLKQLLYLYTQ